MEWFRGASVGTKLVTAAASAAATWLLWRAYNTRKYDREYIVPTVEKPSFEVVGKKVPPALEDVPTLAAEMRASFKRGTSRPYKKRLEQLRKLYNLVAENKDAIVKALKADLGRPTFEAHLYDIEITLGEIKHLMKNLRTLMRPVGTHFHLLTFPSSERLYKEPYGVALVIGTWNYPVMLTLVPLAGAIAAGNTAVLKPSNVSVNVANLVGELVSKYMDPAIVSVAGPGIRGDRSCIQALMEQRWDKIFFTGGPTVGRLIMEKAARYLTPVTLELGGKNPVFIAKDADMALAARRTLWGRNMNAGQQCISPDYVLIEEAAVDKFLAECRKVIAEFYGKEPKTSECLGRIVNDRHHARLSRVLEEHGGEIVVGGDTDAEQRYVAPTVLRLPLDSPVMQDETFGPILMVATVPSMQKAIEYVNSKEKPLSMYIFTNRKSTQEMIVQNTSAGGVTINGTLWHVAHPGLPFGGVGNSGMGAYHGDATFYTFTHLKPVLRKSWLPDWGALSDPFFLYPPWTNLKLTLARIVVGLS